ncbi:MAG: hypothetical protein KGY99_05745 [Phycisphaerae bacterium]|nr:hypothetical protein [Phycisphaerae bacterium]
MTLAILAVLMSILGPAGGRALRLVKVSTSRAHLRSIEGAVDAYAVDFRQEVPPSGDDEGHPDWVPGGSGAQRLAAYLTGYSNSDGLDGWGFHVAGGKKKHGPYNGVEELPMRGSPPTFVDQFDQPVLYYRYDGGYDSEDNHDGPSSINDYARDGNQYRRSDYLLITPGIDGDFEDEPDEGDDITNME